MRFPLPAGAVGDACCSMRRHSRALTPAAGTGTADRGACRAGAGQAKSRRWAVTSGRAADGTDLVLKSGRWASASACGLRAPMGFPPALRPATRWTRESRPWRRGRAPAFQLPHGTVSGRHAASRRATITASTSPLKTNVWR